MGTGSLRSIDDQSFPGPSRLNTHCPRSCTWFEFTMKPLDIKFFVIWDCSYTSDEPSASVNGIEEPRRLYRNHLSAISLTPDEVKWHRILVLCLRNELSFASPADVRMTPWTLPLLRRRMSVMSRSRCLGVIIDICLDIYVQTRKHIAVPHVDTVVEIL
ncbi:hypothetical protein ACTXT7_005984 [Hymenolepis weldensis]